MDFIPLANPNMFRWSNFLRRMGRNYPSGAICLFRNFAKFTGKHLRQSLFFIKVAVLRNFIKKETLA